MDNTTRIRPQKAWESFILKMEESMKDKLNAAIAMAKENVFGQTGRVMKDHGNLMRWKGMVNKLSQTGIDLKAISPII